ncbi:MAG: glycosyltransferase family 4 protein [Candidatus Levybacteria bacterium]|nr:glycosyltransferase family 4 protein [Candidatus Levybacteria bacterium]
MVIGIDGNEANVEKKVGIGEYAYELLLEFAKIQDERKVKFEIFLKENPRSEMPPPNSNLRYRTVGPKKMWTQFGLPLNLFLGKRPDIFFTPTHYAPRFSPIPTVISIMDLSFIHFPILFAKKDLYQLTNWTKYSVKNASKIFTISQFSKSDIIDVYGVDEGKIVVTYPGIKKPTSVRILSMDDLRKKFGIDKNYILFVGTLQPRKNIVKLIEAFSKIEKENLILVVVGKKGWLYEDILSAPGRLGVGERVKFLDFVEDDDLPSLYKNALCFVLPSLYEGFGLPVLEAMKHGCPVLTSNVSSLPEAGGDAAIYFDPNNSDDIKEKIEKVIKNPSLRQEMIEKGYNQIKKFSWEKTAKETLKVLEELASNK